MVPGRRARRVFRERSGGRHPDFRTDAPLDPGLAGGPLSLSAVSDHDSPGGDLAIDFIEMAVFVDRIQSAFFADNR